MFYTYALGDTRANGFLFINIELATLFLCHYGARSKSLSCLISVIGYDSKVNSKIIYYIYLTL